MKHGLGGKIITKFIGLKTKIYGYLIDDGSKNKKLKGMEKCVIKGKLKFEYYKNCLEATQLNYKINYPGKMKLT